MLAMSKNFLNKKNIDISKTHIIITFNKIQKRRFSMNITNKSQKAIQAIPLDNIM